MHKAIIAGGLGVIAILFLLSCRTRTSDGTAHTGVALHANAPARAGTGGIDISVNECLSQFPLVSSEERAGMIRAWSKVPDHDKYRKARPGDFEAAQWKESESDRSYEYGEIAGAYGLVIFVVNKTIEKPGNLGLIVLIQRPGNRFGSYWIYHNEDLSRLALNRLSGDVIVAGRRADGTQTDCEIKWDKKQKTWTCSESWG
jgi:hypothetical protein